MSESGPYNPHEHLSDEEKQARRSWLEYSIAQDRKMPVELPGDVTAGQKIPLLAAALRNSNGISDGARGIALFSLSLGRLNLRWIEHGECCWENGPESGSLPVEIITDRTGTITKIRAGMWMD